MNKELNDWLKSKPGPFIARTHDDVWASAWKNFRAGPTGGLDNEMMYRHSLMVAGFGIRALVIGGYAMDRVS